MDRHDWNSLRHQFIPSSSAAAAADMAIFGQGHLLNESRYKSFLDSYWRHFHPFFPIIHYSALALGPPPPLLALMMVTIGAMLSPSPAPAVAFYKSCVGFFTTVSFFFSPSPPPKSNQPFLLPPFPFSLLSWPKKEKKKERKKTYCNPPPAASRNYDEFSIIGYADCHSAGGVFQVHIKGSKV